MSANSSVPPVRTSVRVTISGRPPFLGVVTYSHINGRVIDVWAPPAVTIRLRREGEVWRDVAGRATRVEVLIAP